MTELEEGLLSILSGHDGYLSAKELVKELASRELRKGESAVYKAIARLRSRGHPIINIRPSGYRLDRKGPERGQAG